MRGGRGGSSADHGRQAFREEYSELRVVCTPFDGRLPVDADIAQGEEDQLESGAEAPRRNQEISR